MLKFMCISATAFVLHGFKFRSSKHLSIFAGVVVSVEARFDG